MSHQPSKSNEEVAQALMMKTAQQGGLHTRDIIKALQDKDADRERAVEEERERIREKIHKLTMIDEKYAHWAKQEILNWCFPAKMPALTHKD